MWALYVLCISVTPYEMLIRSMSYRKLHAIVSASQIMLSMMLHYVNVKSVVSAGLTGKHNTGCSAEIRLVLHLPSSS